MKHFLYKLIPPRPTFDEDMSESEAAIMGRHVAYWQELTEQGTALVFGPFSDPAGAWGLAVVEAETDEQVRALGEADPAVVSGLARFQVCPMPGASAPGSSRCAPPGSAARVPQHRNVRIRVASSVP